MTTSSQILYSVIKTLEKKGVYSNEYEIGPVFYFYIKRQDRLIISRLKIQAVAKISESLPMSICTCL